MDERLYKILHERNAVPRQFARRTFNAWQRFGLHLVADHFYDPVPNTEMIRKTYNAGPRDLPALRVKWNDYVVDACNLVMTHLDDYLKDRHEFGFVEPNYLFEGIDALYYYAYLRDRQPATVVEIGQGFSTRVALAALAHNARARSGHVPTLISIDPYDRLGSQGSSLWPTREQVDFRTIQKTMQEVGDELPEMLSDGDLFFVDSSHVFKYGSDVKYLFEHVYPRLANKSLTIHIHDICTPYDYPMTWMVERKQFWNEQYFLEGFLAFNDRFSVEAPIHYVLREGTVIRLIEERGVPTERIKPDGKNFHPDMITQFAMSFYLRTNPAAS